MADLVGERYVVGMRGPGQRGMLAGGREHRMEREGRAGAGRRAWSEDHRLEAVGGTRRHRALLPRGQVFDDHLKARRSVVHLHGQHVAGIHQQVIGEVGGTGATERIGRTIGDAALGNVGRVDGLQADLALAIGVVVDAVVLVPVEAVNGQPGAPMGGIAAGEPSRRIELHLHVSAPRMLADIIGPRRIGALEDVGVTVGSAGFGKLRRRLRVAHRHPEPERGMKLKVEGARGAGLVGLGGWVLGQHHRVETRVTRPGDSRVEQHRGLIVALVGFKGIGAKPGVFIAEAAAGITRRRSV